MKQAFHLFVALISSINNSYVFEFGERDQVNQKTPAFHCQSQHVCRNTRQVSFEDLALLGDPHRLLGSRLEPVMNNLTAQPNNAWPSQCYPAQGTVIGKHDLVSDQKGMRKGLTAPLFIQYDGGLRPLLPCPFVREN